jgi:hypothetical protein
MSPARTSIRSGHENHAIALSFMNAFGSIASRGMLCRRLLFASPALSLFLSVVHAQAPDSTIGNKSAAGAFGSNGTSPRAPVAVARTSRPPQATIAPIQRTVAGPPDPGTTSAAGSAGINRSATMVASPAAVIPNARGINIKSLLMPQEITSSAPGRAALVNSQRSMLAAQNAAARNARGKAVGGAPEAQATSQPHIARNAWQPTAGIHLVNGKARSFSVTPGGYLTIAGYGLGVNAGEARLLGSGTRKEFPLQVVAWSDGEVYALFPAGLRGVPDQQMMLQVVTREGTTYVHDGASFYAAREEITLTSNLDRVYRILPDPSWPAPLIDAPTGNLMRVEQQESLKCATPGMDHIVFLPLPNGFEVTAASMEHQRTDAGEGDIDGNAGNHLFFPGYSFGSWRINPVPVSRSRSGAQSGLDVNWGVWRSHRSPNYPLTTALDICMSGYRITVTAVGPAGVPVF